MITPARFGSHYQLERPVSDAVALAALSRHGLGQPRYRGDTTCIVADVGPGDSYQSFTVSDPLDSKVEDFLRAQSVGFTKIPLLDVVFEDLGISNYIQDTSPNSTNAAGRELLRRMQDFEPDWQPSAHLAELTRLYRAQLPSGTQINDAVQTRFRAFLQGLGLRQAEADKLALTTT